MTPLAVRLGLAAALMLLPACSMCGGKASDPPSRYVSRAAQMVVEIPEIGALAARRNAIAQRLEGIATKEQIDQAVAELVRTLGFDPTTPEGLEAAGLPKRGAAAIEVLDQGRGALWVVPVGDAKKLDATLNEIVKSKETIAETKKETFEGAELTMHYGQFGPEKMLISAHGMKHGYAFIGAGKNGVEAVKAAIARTKEDSITSHPEHGPLVGSIGDVMARVIVPSAKEMNTMLGAALDLPPDSLALQMKSVGWGLALDEKALSVLLRMRFEDAAKAKLKTIFTAEGKMPAGVAAVLASDAVITLVGSGNVQAFMQAMMPPGSPLASQFADVVANTKNEVGIDLENQVLKQMSGHAAIALGIADASRLSNLRELMMNPARALWSTGAVGLKSPDEVKKMSVFAGGESPDPLLTSKGLARTNRKIKDRDVAVLAMADAPPGADAMLMETWVSGGAWSFSNTGARTEKMIEAEGSPPADKLAGKGGVVVEVRVKPIAAALRTLDIEALAGGTAEAMLVRGFLTKALAILDRLDLVEGRLEQADDGLAGSAKVYFAPAGAAGAAPAKTGS